MTCENPTHKSLGPELGSGDLCLWYRVVSFKIPDNLIEIAIRL